jgi:hypothetical protein
MVTLVSPEGGCVTLARARGMPSLSKGFRAEAGQRILCSSPLGYLMSEIRMGGTCEKLAISGSLAEGKGLTRKQLDGGVGGGRHAGRLWMGLVR